MPTIQTKHFVHLLLVIQSTLHIPTILFSNEDSCTMTKAFVMKTLATIRQCHVLKEAGRIVVRNPMFH